jgi:hypothetical protein
MTEAYGFESSQLQKLAINKKLANHLFSKSRPQSANKRTTIRECMTASKTSTTPYQSTCAESFAMRKSSASSAHKYKSRSRSPVQKKEPVVTRSHGALITRSLLELKTKTKPAVTII